MYTVSTRQGEDRAERAVLRHTTPSRSSRPVRRVAESLAITTVAGWATLSIALLAIGEVMTHLLLRGGFGRWDDSVNRWFVVHRDGPMDHLTRWATLVANTFPVIAIALVLGTIGWFVHRTWRPVLLLAIGLAVELATFLVVNGIVGRPRPAVERMDSTPTTSSFPSGHIAASFVLWGAAWILFSPRVRAAAARHAMAVLFAVVPAVVFVARVYRGMHHLTDVAAGLLLGIGALVTARAAADRWAPDAGDATVVAEEARR